MRTLLILASAVLSGLGAAPAGASTFTPFDQFVFLHIGSGGGGASPLILDTSSPGYSEALDADGFGSYDWTLVNDSGVSWQALSLVYYLDGEWDAADNGYSNEYGQYLGPGLPDGAPAGARAANGWEIDEPEYVFGDIWTHASIDGQLDGANAVGSDAVNDVALAFSWALPTLAPGDRVSLTLWHQTAGVTGIAHHDPDSQAAVIVNGFVRIELAPVDPPPDPPTDPPVDVPEPATVLLLGAAVVVVARRLPRTTGRRG